MDIAQFEYEPRAVSYLADHLNKGTLILFLGAGVSADLGLPNWVDLINSMSSEYGFKPLKSKCLSEDLLKRGKKLKKKCSSELEFLKLLKKHLYINIPDLSPTKLKNDLLIAITALLTGSKRGHIKRIITLNFDSMLEWVLYMHGFVVQPIFSLPQLEGSEDVRIYHPHGFLPHPTLKMIDSKEIIFDLDSINLRLGKVVDSWLELIRYHLRSSICLFIGLSYKSFEDRSLAPLLANTALEKNGKTEPNIWIIKDRTSQTKKNNFLNQNIVPLQIRSKKKIANFLLEICMKASSNIQN